MKKKEPRFPNYSAKVECSQLSIHALISSQGYQKDKLDYRIVNRIVKNFDPHRLGTLQVSQRKGKYYVYDGQHRLSALLTLFPDADFYVWCEIHHDLTYQKEAKLFSVQNDDKSALTAYHKFNGMLEAKDPAAIEINNILTGLGLRLVNGSAGSCHNAVKCVRVISNLHKRHSLYDFSSILELVKSTWNGIPESLDGRIIGGVGLFYDTYKDEIEGKRFIKSLGIMPPKEIIFNGNSDLNAKGDLGFAKAILQQYNKGKKTKLDYKFKG